MEAMKLNLGWEQGNANLTRQVEVSNSLAPVLSDDVPNGSTNLAIGWSIDVSTMTYLYIVASVDMDVTTNEASTGSPQETLELLAGVPVVWYPGCNYTKPFADDVTSIFATNASGTDGTLIIKALSDATPPA